MERITREDVEFYIDKVNRMLQERGKDFYYHFTSRYNYKAIDKCYYYNSGSSDYMTGLTTREAYNIIYAVYQTLEDENYTGNNMELLKNYSLQKLYKVCGYREFEILRTATHETIEPCKDYGNRKIYKISDATNENYFLYDIERNEIVG